MSLRLTQEQLDKLVSEGRVKVVTGSSAGTVQPIQIPLLYAAAGLPATKGPVLGVTAGQTRPVRGYVTRELTLSFIVRGLPIAQPRVKAYTRKHGKAKGKAGVYTPSGKIKPWKKAISAALAGRPPCEPALGAASLDLTFYFPRPKDHFRSNGEIKERFLLAPHEQLPDVENLAKAVMDVLTRERVYKDDGQVNHLTVDRLWAPSSPNAYVGHEGGLRVKLTARMERYR